MSTGFDHDAILAVSADFNKDVHLLVLSTLDAALQSLSLNHEAESIDLERHLPGCSGNDQQRIYDDLEMMVSYLAEQQTFVRNMALVALASRFTHALRRLADAADPWCKCRPSYGKRGDSDFKKLWLEFEDRFGIDVTRPDIKTTIASFTEMSVVRNQIVHEGGQANPSRRPGIGNAVMQPLQNTGGSVAEMRKLWSAIRLDEEDDLKLDFSEQYPEFVEGKGPSAMVRVTQIQLQSLADRAEKFVSWLASHLRELELEAEKRTI